MYMPFKQIHVEKENEKYRIYSSMLVDPRNLSILGSPLSIKIIRELSKQPSCAMDVVRNLGVDKQKVYYHLKKLEESGVVRLVKSEQRHGMTAKVYEAVSPVVSTKLYDDFREEDLSDKIQKFRDAEKLRFLRPFINGGEINAKIIFGDPYPHGKYDRGSSSSVHAFNFVMLLGKYINDEKAQIHRLDTETRDSDLSDNLIIFGSPKGNTITDKLNSMGVLPVHFDPNKEWSIVSKKTGKSYSDPRTAVIIKCDNPFNKNKKVLLIAGIRTRGMRGASIALVNHVSQLLEGADENGNFMHIIEGQDKDGDMVIDSVKFME